MSRRQAVVAGLLSALVVLLPAAPAQAHSDLEDSVPAPEARLAHADHVRLDFDEPVQLAGTGLQVRDADGDLVASRRSSPHGLQVEAPLPADLAAGTYTVGWVVRSDDGDVVSGAYQFTLTAGSGSGGPSWWLVGGLGLLVLGLAAGAVGARRRSRSAGVAALLLLAAGAALLVHRVAGSGSSAQVDVTADPAAVGLNTVTVQLPDKAPYDQVDVRVVLDRTHTVVDVPVVGAGDGTYRARDVNLPLPGDWRASVAVRRGDQQQLLSAEFTVVAR